MKLLFAIDSVDFPTAVNPQLAARLAGQLVKMGHAVTLLRLWDGATPLPSPPEGVAVEDIAFPDERQMNIDLENGRKNGSPTPVRLARLATHPTAVAAAFRQLILHKNRRQIVCTKAMEALDAREHFDAAIAVCAPYHTAWALADAKLHCKKATWQMDPYSANKEYTPYGGAEKENSMYGKMDKLFITKLMKPDYESGPLAGAKPKTQVLEFPCLSPMEYSAPAPHEGINCVFAGSLHPVIRQPYSILELFATMNRPDVTLTMVGGGWENFDEIRLAPMKKKLGSRLVITGQVPPSVARQYMAEADVLVNLGNTVTNQLPSKIFEYFSAGSPVLNLCANPDDPALDYFAQYPLALTLHQNGDTEAQAKALSAWLDSIRGQRVPFAESERIFKKNAPAAVAEALLEGLQ